jgi:hypothetical protein
LFQINWTGSLDIHVDVLQVVRPLLALCSFPSKGKFLIILGKPGVSLCHSCWVTCVTRAAVFVWPQQMLGLRQEVLTEVCISPGRQFPPGPRLKRSADRIDSSPTFHVTYIHEEGSLSLQVSSFLLLSTPILLCFFLSFFFFFFFFFAGTCV